MAFAVVIVIAKPNHDPAYFFLALGAVGLAIEGALAFARSRSSR